MRHRCLLLHCRSLRSDLRCTRDAKSLFLCGIFCWYQTHDGTRPFELPPRYAVAIIVSTLHITSSTVSGTSTGILLTLNSMLYRNVTSPNRCISGACWSRISNLLRLTSSHQPIFDQSDRLTYINSIIPSTEQVGTQQNRSSKAWSITKWQPYAGRTALTAEPFDQL